MAKPLNILIVSSECTPFAKTGGMGDVVGSLPVFLKKLGHDVRIVIPKYSFINDKKHWIKPALKKMNVQMGNVLEQCSVFSTALNEIVPVYLIEYHEFYDRAGIYHDSEFNDYDDNPKRFAFLSKAALQLCSEIKFIPDVIHANDWHTAVIPAYLKKLFKNDPVLGKTASVLTIHNIAYQGRYSKYYYNYTGLPKEDFTSEKFECFGAVNFLKGGIHYADMVNTVSHGYATETRTLAGGYGMDYFLNIKGANYIGILNGADYSVWDPATDKLIPANYSPIDLKGKHICKKALQKQLGLRQLARTPVIGIISRFVEQKGLYILSECIENIIHNMNVQFAILGAGDRQLETYFGSLPQQHAGKIGCHVGYDNELAHLIEAGSDFFLMPSLYEPCGLNQIYSMKYGTIPIIRATGGLDETVENYNHDTGEGTGFKFQDPDGKAVYNIIELSLHTYFKMKPHFKKLIQNAMKQCFSWEDSAAEYVRLYMRAIENRSYTGDSTLLQQHLQI
ncbi:MAG: glycogen synthase GlgA [Spirochaetes bacterium]|nr:glycogen synthase GlgA [Spirochaetota bacterium]